MPPSQLPLQGQGIDAPFFTLKEFNDVALTNFVK